MRKRTAKRDASPSDIKPMNPWPSCNYCGFLVLDYCIKYESKVPDDFVMQKNDCEFFKDGLDG